VIGPSFANDVERSSLHVHPVGKGLVLAKPSLPDELWELIRPLIPPHPPQPKGGRPFLDDRKVLTGIIFILKTGLPREDLPQEMGCGCGLTCWNRLRDRQAAGVWDRIHQILLAHLRHAGRIDFARFIADTGHVRAVGGGEATGPGPVDRSKPGSQPAVLTDGQGVPLVIDTLPANPPDFNQAVPLVDAVPPIAGPPGHPRKRPDPVMGDRGFDDEEERQKWRDRGIDPESAKRRTPHGSGLGVDRWAVERTISWSHQFRRLRVRYDFRDAIHQGLCTLAEILITYRFLVLYGVT
jgi:transposase